MGRASRVRPEPVSSANPVRTLLAEAAAGYGVPLSDAQLDQLEGYIALVMRWGRVANLTGAASAMAFAREQVVDSLAVARRTCRHTHGHTAAHMDIGTDTHA